MLLNPKLALLVWSLAIVTPVTASSNSCAKAVSSIHDAEIKSIEDPGFIKRSMPAMVVSSAIWLTIVRSVIAKQDISTILNDPVFGITLVSGITLASMSHVGSLLPALKNVLKNDSGRYDLATRSTALITMGTTAILASWYFRGVEFNKTHACMAAGLCAAVYPPLIKMKQALHQKLPLFFDKEALSKFADNHQGHPGIQEILEYTRTRLQESGLTKQEADVGVMLALEWQFVTKIAFEKRMQNTALSGVYAKELSKIHKAQGRSKQRLRRRLLNKMLKDYSESENQEVYEEVLHLGEPLSRVESFYIHKWLSERHAAKSIRLNVKSFVDQAVSVGFADGVLLWNLNEWVINNP